MSVLHEIALALSGELDRRRLYEGIVQGARRLLGVPIAAVMSWDPGRGELVTEAASGELPQVALPPNQLPALIGRAFEERNTVMVDDFEAQPRTKSPRYALARRLGAAAATPLLRRQLASRDPDATNPGSGQERAPIGIIFVAHRRDEVPASTLDLEDVRVLEVLAEHVAEALSNAETVAGAIRRLARVEELAGAYRSIVEARDRDVIVSRALDCATTILGADRAAVYLADRRESLVHAAGRRLSRHYLEAVGKGYRRSVGQTVMLARAPIYVADMSTDPRTRVLHDIAAAEGIRSALVVPLLYRNELMGALALYHDLVWRYDAEDITPVKGLADQVALALANAALHDQTQRQLAELRVLDAVVRGVSEPVTEEERERRAVQAITMGGGATCAWVFRSHPGGLRLAAHAGMSTIAEEDAADAAVAALEAQKTITHPLRGEALVAAPIVYREELLGVLVLSPPRAPRNEGRPGTTHVQFGEENLPAERHEFASTAAGQLATAITHARLYAAAHDASSRLAAILVSMPDGILVYDQAERIVFYNEHALDLLELKGTDPTGWGQKEWIAAMRDRHTDFEAVAAAVEQAKAAVVSGGAVHRMDLEFSRPRRRVLERISAPVRSPAGEFLGQVVVLRERRGA
jgi:GAF domain-containing protein